MINLAWRNIWRNKRRTFITLAAIVFAVFFAITMRSLQLGMYGNMIHNVVGFYSGYAQIHQKGYWDDKSIDNSFEFTEELKALGTNSENKVGFLPRLETFALASAVDVTRGCMIVGTDPELENQLTHINDKIIKGRTPAADASEILVAEGLAEYLKLDVGDTLVLIGQGYHGTNAAGKFPVCGIVKFGSPKLNDQLAYLPLAAAQYMTGAEGMLTSLVIMPDENRNIEETIAALSSQLGENYEVMKWQEMMPDVVQAIQADNAGGILMLIILYLVIGFGLFGTILMMTAERRFEFGILMAIGMRRGRLASMVVLETALLSIVGAITGIIVSIPITVMGYLYPLEFSGMAAEGMERMGIEPIIPFSLDPSIFLSQGAIVLTIALLLSLYPIRTLFQLKAVQAMRN